MKRANRLSYETARWSASAATVVGAHAVIVAVALAWVRAPEVQLPEPPVLVELPPLGSADAVSAPQPSELAPPAPQVPQPMSRVEVPIVQAPLPQDAVRLPPPSPARSVAVQRPAQAVAAAPQPALAAARAEASADVAGGDDPRARKAEADYKSLVGSYIRRNRFSPPQSRKAGLSGDVKVRFAIDRSGRISEVAVAQSSGHSLLDEEAAQFIRRLSPVPAFPRDLRKAEIPLSITLKFALESK